MKVFSREAAWEKVDEIFPTDYYKNEVKSANAGYPVFDSNLGDEKGYICDLGSRLEVNLGTGDTINIWIEDPEKNIPDLFSNWLKCYTHEVIIKVMEKRDEIVNNPFAMNLLKELKQREEEEEKEFRRAIGYLVRNFDTFKDIDPHNHCMTHSKSYRDVLYDMYIK